MKALQRFAPRPRTHRSAIALTALAAGCAGPKGTLVQDKETIAAQTKILTSVAPETKKEDVQAAQKKISDASDDIVAIATKAQDDAAKAEDALKQQKANSLDSGESNLCTSVVSSTTGYILKCRTLKNDPFLGAPTALKVAYSIDNATPKVVGAAMGVDPTTNATQWVIEIPEHLKAGQSISLSLSYIYKPGPAVTPELNAELTALQTQIVQDVTAAIAKQTTEKPWDKAVSEDASKYPLLAQAVGADGKPVLPVFFAALGFVSTDGQKFTPGPTAIALINESIVTKAKAGVLSPKALGQPQVGKDIGPDTCVNAADWKTYFQPPSREKAEAILKCAGNLLAPLVKPLAAAKRAAPAAWPAECDAVDAVPAGLAATIATPVTDADVFLNSIATAYKTLQEGQAKCPALSSGQPLKDLSTATRLLSYATHFSAVLASMQDSVTQQVATHVAAIVAEPRQVTPTQMFLTADAERRHYSVSSGLLFLAGTQTMTIPILATVCPWGCLRDDQQFWQTPHSAAQALAVDLGVAAGTVNTFTDPRLAKAPGFYLGASYQLLSPFRISAGLYFFENQQTNAWQGDLGLGITLDAGAAIEILKLFGVTVPTVLSNANPTSSPPAAQPATPAAAPAAAAAKPP
jgi:hypothetical protein